VLQIVHKKPAANNEAVVLNGILRLRDNLLPTGTLRAGAGNFEYPLVGRIFIAREIDVPIIDLAIVEKVLAAGDGYEFAVGLGQVLQEQVTLGPALGNVDQQPLAVFRDNNTGPMLRIESFAKYQWVFQSISMVA